MACASAHAAKCSFSKIQGDFILIFFCQNLHKATFYNKEQTQKSKYEIWVLKTTILDPWKSMFFMKTEKLTQFFFFFVFRHWFSFKNNRHTNVLLEGIFENALLAVKNAILTVLAFINFFVHFQKYWLKQHFWVNCFLRWSRKKKSKTNLMTHKKGC